MTANDTNKPLKNDTPPVIVFDGVCNLCNTAVNFVIKHDRQGKIKFASAQSAAGQEIQRTCGIDALDDETVILVKDGTVFTHSDVTIQIAKELDGFWTTLSYLKIVPKPIRDWSYRKIAKNRYKWFGKKEQCAIPDTSIEHRFLI